MLLPHTTVVNKAVRHVLTGVSNHGQALRLDDTDRAILQLLQRDARHSSAVEMAEQIGVSDGTVRNRIEQLEQRGVIEGYAPMINYEEAGYQLQVRLMCTSSIVDRHELAKAALDVEGVVEVHEVMSGNLNVEVKAVVPRNHDLTRIAFALDDLGLSVETEELISHHFFRPFDHFGTETVGEDPQRTHEM